MLFSPLSDLPKTINYDIEEFAFPKTMRNTKLKMKMAMRNRQ